MTNNTAPADDWQLTIQRHNLKPLTPAGYITIGIFLTLLGLSAAACNAATLVMFLRIKKLRQKPHNLLLLNLAVADLGICVLGYPFTAVSSFAQRWVWGESVCKIQGFTNFTLALTSMYTLTCISVYRYVALCKPQPNHLLNKKMTKKIIGVIWSSNLFITVPPLVGWTSYTYEPWGTGCSIDWTNPRPTHVAYIMYCIIFCYLNTVCVMAYCYCRMVQRLNKLHSAIWAARHNVVSLTEAETAHKMAAESRVTWITLAMVTTFVLLWSPYAWLGVWMTLVGSEGVPVWVQTLPNLLAKTTCLLNPLIYIFTSASFRQGLKACCRGNSRVRDKFRKSATSTKNVFKINKTGEGIYIGENQVHLSAAETTMF